MRKKGPQPLRYGGCSVMASEIYVIFLPGPLMVLFL